MDSVILSAIAPIVILLSLAITAAVLSRSFRASPIVGYLLLGVALTILGLNLVESSQAVAILAQLGGATGRVGLSLTLGAFLGGVTLAETPYRAVVAAEIKPFRGLLLGFFFIAVGTSLNPRVLADEWLAILGITAGLLAVKILTNAAASLVFRWSVPGSTQLAFLLAQGSEFAFVMLSLPWNARQRANTSESGEVHPIE